MSNFDDTDLESIARLPLVGIDGIGAAHYFDWNRDVVYVLADDGLKHTEALEQGELPAWIDYVGEKRGWRDCRYDTRPLPEMVADAVGA